MQFVDSYYTVLSWLLCSGWTCQNTTPWKTFSLQSNEKKMK